MHTAHSLTDTIVAWFPVTAEHPPQLPDAISLILTKLQEKGITTYKAGTSGNVHRLIRLFFPLTTLST